ncbi:hypothetical protein [Candidatus Leptofilum sp.]|uniref:hypothetical protein n=1 Tax=Candidatus Leptofilum sp. TaxID=3241576 RepID=UPI003B5B0C9E
MKTIKRYEYGRFFRIFWLIGFPFTLGMLGLVWAVWPANGRGWLLLVEGLILLYSVYSGWSLLATFGSVELTSDEAIVRQFGRTVALSYDSIQNVRRSQIALTIKTHTKRFFWSDTSTMCLI